MSQVTPKDEIAELDEALNLYYGQCYHGVLDDDNDGREAILSLKAKWQVEAKESATKLYQKELEHWKRAAELFLEREQTKLPEHVFCSGCGKTLMEGKSLKLNDQSSKPEGGDSA